MDPERAPDVDANGSLARQESCSFTDLAKTRAKTTMDSCNVMNELRLTGQLCDATVKVEDGSFPVHRAILSACSPYFRALFTNGMTESAQSEVFIPGIDKLTMNHVIEYAYTHNTKIDSRNVEHLLPAADQFHVLGLLKACCHFLLNSFDENNVVGIRNFARAYFCTSLARKTHNFILENFQKLAEKSTELLQISVTEMAELLSSDDLNVKNEEIVFEAAIRWIDHDPESRRPDVVTLMNCVRLGLLSTQFFVEKVKIHPYIRDNEDCRPLIIDTLKFLYDLDMDTEREVDLSHPLSRPRVPHEVMFVIGGWSGGAPTAVCETYDTRADRWIIASSPDDKGPRAYHGLAALGKMIYCIGGFDGMDYFNSVRRFDPVTHAWEEVAPMNSRRCYVSVTVADDFIYAMGGFDGHIRQNSAERYSPATNQWSLISPMHQQRSDASASSLQGKVYIVGGFNGQECLMTAECFDPLSNQWTLLSSMRNRRSGVGMVAHGQCLYAVGGFNGISRMNNGEKYNVVTNTWSPIAEMYGPRSNFGIEVIDDMVFAIGGFNGVTTIYNVECYDPVNDEWYDCTDMNIYRSALSACVVRGLPNVRDYIHADRTGLSEERKRRQSERAAERAAENERDDDNNDDEDDGEGRGQDETDGEQDADGSDTSNDHQAPENQEDQDHQNGNGNDDDMDIDEDGGEVDIERLPGSEATDSGEPVPEAFIYLENGESNPRIASLLSFNQLPSQALVPAAAPSGLQHTLIHVLESEDDDDELDASLIATQEGRSRSKLHLTRRHSQEQRCVNVTRTAVTGEIQY